MPSTNNHYVNPFPVYNKATAVRPVVSRSGSEGGRVRCSELPGGGMARM